MHFFLHQWDPKSLAALDGSVLELIWGKKTPATTLLESKHKHTNPENGMVDDGWNTCVCLFFRGKLTVSSREGKTFLIQGAIKFPLMRSWARWSFGPPAATPKSLGKL